MTTSDLDKALSRLTEPSNQPSGPEGRMVGVLSHGTMRLDVSVPGKAECRPEPPIQDTLYILAKGSGTLVRDGSETLLGRGDAVMIAAGEDHRFTGLSDDFACWVVHWGPEGGEAPVIEPSVFAAIDA